MNKRTHWTIARLTVGKINEMFPEYQMKGFKRFLFYIGTIEPDLSIMQFAHPHYYEKSAGYIYLKILKMKGKECNGLLDAYRLGTLVHYLCDFCCYAHISGGIGAITGHVNYERKINKYLNNNYSLFHKGMPREQITEAKYADIISFIDEAIRQYKTSKPSFLVDIKNSIEVSSALILDMVSELKSIYLQNGQSDLISI